MKEIIRRLTTLAMIVTAIVGCDKTNQGPTAPQSRRGDVGKVGSIIYEDTYERTLNFTDGQIFLFHPSENRETRELFVPLRSTVQSVSMGEFVLRLFNPASDSSQAIGGEIYSHSGELLFGLQIEIDSVSVSWSRITEYTSLDRLSMLRTFSSDSVVETYTEDTNSFSVGMSRELFEYLSSEHQGTTADSIQNEYLAAYEYFTAHYSPGSSLTSNSDGELLVSVMTNRELYGWLELSHADMRIRPLAKDITLDDVCVVADICAMIKCSPLGGGLLNPLCITCTGVSLACLVVDAFNFISKWF